MVVLRVIWILGILAFWKVGWVNIKASRWLNVDSWRAKGNLQFESAPLLQVIGFNSEMLRTPKKEGHPWLPDGGRIGPPNPGGPTMPPGVGRFGGWISAVPPLPIMTEPNTEVTEPTELYSGNVIATTVGV